MATPVQGTATEITEPTGEVQGTPENTPGPNPAWSEVLNVLPEQFHPMVTPVFQKWDQAANSRIETVNEQLKSFEAYQPFVEHGIGQEDLVRGLQLMQMLNENPQQVYEMLAQQLGTQQQGEQPNNPQGTEYTGEASQYTVPEDYDQIKQGMEFLAQQYLEQQEAAEQQAANDALEKDLQAVKEKFGDFNESHFLPYLSAAIDRGLNTEQAAQEFFAMRDEMVKSHQASQPYAPKVLGANSGNGAGLPSNAIDVTKLNGKETRNLVVEYLKHAANQNG